MKRRSFLKTLATAGVLLPAVTGLRNARAFAQSPSPYAPFARPLAGNPERVIVILRLFGGNDGLNTLVPVHDENYYNARMRDAPIDIALKPEETLALPTTGTLRLHPSLAPLLPLFDEEKIAIVQNVGYPDQDLSHFRSTDIWLSGSDASVYEETGWLARYLEERYPDYPTVLPPAPFAVELGTSIGRALLGHHTPLGYPLADASFVPSRPEGPEEIRPAKAAAEEAYVREGMRQANVFLNAIRNAQEREPANRVSYPGTPLARDLSGVARLIAAGLGSQIYLVNTAIYDFHATQIRDQAEKFNELGPALASFQRDLEAFGVDGRVTTMTISEFGRRVVPGGSGTDHGAASMLFAIGSRVRSGVIGEDPDLGDLDRMGNLKVEFDFRQIYGTILHDWLDATPDEARAALLRDFATVPIFRKASTATPFTPARDGAGEQLLELPTPNPASDVVHLRRRPIARDMEGVLHIRVSDVRGRPLYVGRMGSGEESLLIDVRAWPGGVYLCEARMDDRRTVREMVVRR